MVKSETELRTLLNRLIAGWENEVVEFKNVGDSYSTSDIGKYVSALANEANLRELESAWLVFGVDNTSRTIVDSDYRRDRERLDGLKKQINDGLYPNSCSGRRTLPEADSRLRSQVPICHADGHREAAAEEFERCS